MQFSSHYTSSATHFPHLISFCHFFLSHIKSSTSICSNPSLILLVSRSFFKFQVSQSSLSFFSVPLFCVEVRYKTCARCVEFFSVLSSLSLCDRSCTSFFLYFWLFFLLLCIFCRVFALTHRQQSDHTHRATQHAN